MIPLYFVVTACVSVALNLWAESVGTGRPPSETARKFIATTSNWVTEKGRAVLDYLRRLELDRVRFARSRLLPAPQQDFVLLGYRPPSPSRPPRPPARPAVCVVDLSKPWTLQAPSRSGSNAVVLYEQRSLSSFPGPSSSPSVYAHFDPNTLTGTFSLVLVVIIPSIAVMVVVIVVAVWRMGGTRGRRRPLALPAEEHFVEDTPPTPLVFGNDHSLADVVNSLLQPDTIPAQFASLEIEIAGILPDVPEQLEPVKPVEHYAPVDCPTEDVPTTTAIAFATEENDINDIDPDVFGPAEFVQAVVGPEDDVLCRLSTESFPKVIETSGLSSLSDISVFMGPTMKASEVVADDRSSHTEVSAIPSVPEAMDSGETSRISPSTRVEDEPLHAATEQTLLVEDTSQSASVASATDDAETTSSVSDVCMPTEQVSLKDEPSTVESPIRQDDIVPTRGSKKAVMVQPSPSIDAEDDSPVSTPVDHEKPCTGPETPVPEPEHPVPPTLQSAPVPPEIELQEIDDATFEAIAQQLATPAALNAPITAPGQDGADDFLDYVDPAAPPATPEVTYAQVAAVVPVATPAHKLVIRPRRGFVYRPWQKVQAVVIPRDPLPVDPVINALPEPPMERRVRFGKKPRSWANKQDPENPHRPAIIEEDNGKPKKKKEEEKPSPRRVDRFPEPDRWFLRGKKVHNPHVTLPVFAPRPFLDELGSSNVDITPFLNALSPSRPPRSSSADGSPSRSTPPAEPRKPKTRRSGMWKVIDAAKVRAAAEEEHAAEAVYRKANATTIGHPRHRVSEEARFRNFEAQYTRPHPMCVDVIGPLLPPPTPPPTPACGLSPSSSSSHFFPSFFPTIPPSGAQHQSGDDDDDDDDDSPADTPSGCITASVASPSTSPAQSATASLEQSVDAGSVWNPDADTGSWGEDPVDNSTPEASSSSSSATPPAQFGSQSSTTPSSNSTRPSSSPTSSSSSSTRRRRRRPGPSHSSGTQTSTTTQPEASSSSSSAPPSASTRRRRRRPRPSRSSEAQTSAATQPSSSSSSSPPTSSQTQSQPPSSSGQSRRTQRSQAGRPPRPPRSRSPRQSQSQSANAPRAPTPGPSSSSQILRPEPTTTSSTATQRDSSSRRRPRPQPSSASQQSRSAPSSSTARVTQQNASRTTTGASMTTTRPRTSTAASPTPPPNATASTATRHPSTPSASRRQRPRGAHGPSSTTTSNPAPPPV